MDHVNLLARFARCSRRRFHPAPRSILSTSACTRLFFWYRIHPWASRRTVVSSPQAVIRDLIAWLPPNHEWGGVIYRCTYIDDKAWEQFRSEIEAKSRRRIAESDAPEIADRLECTWIEDAATLDSISTPALRERFRAFIAEEKAQQPGNYSPDALPRFSHFIKVDQEVLDSVSDLDAHQLSMSRTAIVKFVDAAWEPSPPQQREEDDDFEDDMLEPIDGFTDEDVGWMRINPRMIKSDFYETMWGGLDAWDVFYERPPRIVDY